MKEIKQLNSEEILDKVFELIEIFTNEHKSNQTSKYGEVVEAASQYACDSCRYNVGEPDDEVCGWCLDNLDKNQNFKKEEVIEEKVDKRRGAIANILNSHYYTVHSEAVNDLYRLPSFIDWGEIREDFLNECVSPVIYGELRKVDITPHDLFEWFKDKLS